MSQQFWVGECLVDLSRNQITKDNEPQSLQPKALDVLNWLAQHQGQVVSQDDLFDNIWTGTIVSPNTLQRCIAQLRKALGDDSKQQKVIKTHAKKGYSLESPVRWQEPQDPLQKQIVKQQAAKENTAGEQTSEVQNLEEQIAAESNTDVSVVIPGEASEAASTAEGSISELNHSQPHQGIGADLPTSSGKSVGKWLGILTLLSLAIWFFVGAFSESEHPISIRDIRPITSTDNRELASIYSPDGEYVVFKRFPDIMCISHIWAKHLETQQEFRLTEEPGTYGRPSFSADGKTLAFVKQDDCTATPTRNSITQKICYELQSVDFGDALQGPLMPSVHMECRNSEIRDAKWLTNHEIALLQEQDGRWKLIRYSVTRDTSDTLYASETGNLVHYDYSSALDLIALVSVQDNHELYISMLSPEGSILSSHKIQYPQQIAQYRHIYPNFSSLDNQLIFSTGRQLFTLSHEGDVSKINVALDKAMGTPVFHPDGKHMLAIKGYYDADVAAVPLAQFASESPLSEGQHLEYKVIDRSTLGEGIARFQPRGDAVAWWSNRSGVAQIWLTDEPGSRPLSDFPMDTYIDGFNWAEDGQSLLVNASSQLWQIYLDGRAERMVLQQPIARLFDWDSKAKTALVLISVNGIEKFAEIDLVEAEIRILNHKNVVWSQKTDAGTLIYMDNLDRFWRPGAAEDKLIPALDGQGSDKRFVIKDELIYGINADFQLWSYHLLSNQFSVIAHLPDTIDNIDDAGEESLLMTIRIAARKDVVEMSLQ